MPRNFSVNNWAWVLLAIGALLLLAHLGNGRLWQDEAETAVLAKNTLRFGYPCAFDGTNRLNPSLPVQEGSAWTYHTWLPIYLTSLSFWLLGADTFPARLPSALLGIAALWLAFRLFRRLTGDLPASLLGLFLLTTSVPFLLHMRQCRYYAAAVFFTLWAVWAYLRFTQARPWSSWELSAALILLFHADHGVFVPILLGLAIHLVWKHPWNSRRGLSVVLVVLACVVPWAVYLEVLQHHKVFSLKGIRHHAEFYFRQINHFVIPVVFWAPALLLWRPLRRVSFRGGDLVGVLLLVGLGFLVLLPEQRHFRYLVFLIPFLLLLEAVLLARIFQIRRGLAIALLAILAFTDLLHGPRGTVRSLPLEFAGELTHPYRGPIDGIVELLRSRGRPGQSVKVPYEEHPILFYTDCIVEPVVAPIDFQKETFPDWIILRRDWISPDFLQSRYFHEIEARCERILLDAPDIPWQNRPDPGYHRFRSDRKTPGVVAYRKIQGGTVD